MIVSKEPGKKSFTLKEGDRLVFRELLDGGETEIEITHEGRSSSDVVIGAVLDGKPYKAKAVLRMLKGAEGSEGSIKLRALLLSDTPVIQEPWLDIRTGNVKAAHSASIERLDHEKLFYLMSRGISDAENELVEAFKRSVIEGQ